MTLCLVDKLLPKILLNNLAVDRHVILILHSLLITIIWKTEINLAINLVILSHLIKAYDQQTNNVVTRTNHALTDKR